MRLKKFSYAEHQYTFKLYKLYYKQYSIDRCSTLTKNKLFSRRNLLQIPPETPLDCDRESLFLQHYFFRKFFLRSKTLVTSFAFNNDNCEKPQVGISVGAFSGKNLKKMPSFKQKYCTLAPIKAVIVRLTFVIHSLVAVYRVVAAYENELFWLLSLLLIGLLIETVITLVKRSGKEWTW